LVDFEDLLHNAVVGKSKADCNIPQVTRFWELDFRSLLIHIFLISLGLTSEDNRRILHKSFFVGEVCFMSFSLNTAAQCLNM
jgi:hypothetical protein